ncbi:MAG: hypothetical protein RJA76_590 [Bacteroidota bacterium]|jgi:hypothetical protein
MKRLSALFLMIVLLYQAGGFALQYLTQSSKEISLDEIKQLDKVVVKLPISLPYSENWETPKEVSGQVQKGDEFYQMVEQKMEGDTLYTTLVANHSARESFMDLASMVDQHLKNDASSNKQSKSSLINLLIKEYCSIGQYYVLYLLDWSQSSDNFPVIQNTSKRYSSELFSPPKHC